ncbi:OsmC family protein [Peteryoungia ipomoeae]|uniref:OsmC family protein n=1 Tax=Peteryoungia ipomoeae TaxID=1210932 RepID=A0A4S8NYM5_9HYPH|nr:OsmC family protein [Peteryoungia ipomoeae]THV20254.1 OsmC family protein [Peteryoungia ipomoeae]
MVNLKARVIGATAKLGRAGYPSVRSASGGEIEVVTGPSHVGFDPVDLLLASLVACISMSVRIAARRLGHANGFEEVRVEASAEKAKDGSHRIDRFIVTVALMGQISAEDQRAIVELADSICTVSNSLSPLPEIRLCEAKVQGNNPPSIAAS